MQNSTERDNKRRTPQAFLPEDRLFALLETSQEDSRVQLYTPPGELTEYNSSSNQLHEEPQDNAATAPATYTILVPNQSVPRGPNFLDWVRFDEATLPPRENLQPSRANKVLSPLDKFKADLPGGVHLEGLGGLAESVHNLFHSVKRLDFMQSQRAIRLPLLKSSPAGFDDSIPPAMLRRELERLENELFDLTKYNGACEYLTALAWSEEARSGSITLFEVNLDDRYRRERDVAVGIRPIAAMQNVPKPVLSAMRAHDKVKRKVVFVPSDEEARRFKWKANPSRGPTYVRLPAERRSGDDSVIDTETLSALAPPRSPRSPGGSSRSHSRHERPGSASSYASSTHSTRSRMADADGIRATIPQFVALLHASRAILEDVESTSMDPLETEEGDVLPAVTLTRTPRANSHEGDSVHVAVLMPSDSDWTDDQIVWTDRDGLAEFRRRKFWDLIEWESRREQRERRRRRHSSHSAHSTHSGRREGSVSPRVRSSSQHSTHSRASHSRSTSRHLDLPSLF
ncbi:hypothetical protein B0H66DRAFT_552597 [Apodospora peruviana]|uniref:Uncharacterized protein n=1 Tax=Apodospora peruviana TaxID=516989 RepID=A0AAE0IB41_9PEZI|nr:hypothetical protein B0H66DRAFT_552597 [Apodospora peruviana]